MTKSIFLALFLALISCSSFAQKALMLEKGGSFKTKKYYVGDQLVYKMKSDQKQWLSEYIQDINVEAGYLLFEHRAVPIGEVYAIQIRDGGGAAKMISALLTTFSYSWGFWTLVSAAFGDTINAATLGIGVGSFAVGQLLKLAFFKTFKVNGRKRLRLIDLTFYDPIPSRS